MLLSFASSCFIMLFGASIFIDTIITFISIFIDPIMTILSLSIVTYSQVDFLN